MTAVRQEVGSAAAAAVAAACAEQLTELVERTDGRCALGADPVPPGFAAGPAGIGWALTRFAAAGADQSYSRAGHRAVLAARAGAAGRTTSPGWCRGTAGVLVAVTCLADDRGTAELPSSLRILDGQPVLGDLSLCHGDLGIAEALTVLLAAADHGGAASRARRHRAGLSWTPSAGMTGTAAPPAEFPPPGCSTDWPASATDCSGSVSPSRCRPCCCWNPHHHHQRSSPGLRRTVQPHHSEEKPVPESELSQVSTHEEEHEYRRASGASRLLPHGGFGLRAASAGPRGRRIAPRAGDHLGHRRRGGRARRDDRRAERGHQHGVQQRQHHVLR